MKRKRAARAARANAPPAAHNPPPPTPPARPSLAKKLFFALLPLLALLAIGEGLAHLIPGDLKSNRYFYVAGGHEEYFGTRKVAIPYRTIPPYHWIPAAFTPITNNKGFRGRDWADTKPPGVVRIASLGDSCTLGGQEPYSQRLDRLLEEALGGRRYEILNGGVGSSSTHQMLQIFEQHLLPMQPDQVLLFLGWNDRWVHDGRRDATHQLPTPGQRSLRDLLLRLRLFKALVYFADKRSEGRIEQRVPPAETAKNLRKLAALCRDRQLPLFLCTTPSGMRDEVIRTLFDPNRPTKDWYADLYSLVRDTADTPVGAWHKLHDTYNQTLKDTAAEVGATVIDLDRLIPERQKLYPEPPHYFYKDGIHFTELGLQEVARALALNMLKGDNLGAVERYVDSAAYYVTNAFVFAGQFQYPAADEFLTRGQAAAGQPLEDVEALRADIAAHRPFYEKFDRARIELSNNGDPARALADYQACLAMRPGDANLRLEVADMAKNQRQFQLALQTALGNQTGYDAQQMNRALWIGAESAAQAGDQATLIRLLQELVRRYPQDARAREILRQVQG